MIGIYCIEGKKNYVGSSIDVNERILAHFSDLRLEKHVNVEMQADFDDSFTWRLLEECTEADLLKREQYWCKSFGSDNLYNQTENVITKMPDCKNEYVQKFYGKCWVAENGCWEWPVPKGNKYGRTKIHGYPYAVHRLSHWFAYQDTNINHLLVRHTCNNPACVNPTHLILGSHSQNSHDKAKSGRQPNSVLTQEIVDDLRKYRTDNYANKQQILCYAKDKYNIIINHSVYVKMITNKTFINKKYVYTKINPNNEDLKSSKLNWGIVEYIRNQYLNHTNNLHEIQRKVYKKYNLDVTVSGVIWKVVHNKSWKK